MLRLGRPHGQRLGEALCERGGRSGVGALELGGEEAKLLLGPGVIVSLQRSAQAPAHRGAIALGQVFEHVSLLVAHAALDRGVLPEHVADRPPERFGAVEHAEHALSGVGGRAPEFQIGRVT